MTTTMTETKPIAQAIEEAQGKYLSEKIFRSRWKTIRASGIDDPCNRRLYYYMTCGELANDVTTDLAAIFEEGKDQEPGVRRYLSELGFEVLKAQSTESWDHFNISGSVDGIIEYQGQRYVAEIKTVSEGAWDKLHTSEDFLASKWYRKWYGQMQVYLLLFGLERGLFILKRKQAKQVRVIEIGIEFEYADGLLKKASTVNQAIKDGVEPDFLHGNPAECKACPFFGKVCNPPLDFGEGTQNIEDTELSHKLARREELAAARSEYEKIDKEVKERVKDIPHAVCGDFEITGKAGVMKFKAQEAREVKTWKVSIERIGAQGAV